ncbi:site-specific integrase [Escherichia coli]|uniref:site-specific integrase n=1 Tax=Escherichia coli TaxID=562 RepID=UPI000BE86494|nr:site-specific integrase [Escherichia coli]EEQ4752828.1 site-specific integrase [Escherichia coli]EEQ4880758.1 site-specific integrase [Escherichia coli]EFE0732074.1 site-specific integrase [Escherichia coli]EFK7610822.1 site-specific integrase [Escherichia coli]EHR0207305.1 site-specific integrase [Escherichia coli]
MSVKKLTSGEWLCDFRVDGAESRRVRKKFSTKGEAVAFEQYYREKAQNKPWMGEKEDRRRLSELIELWHNLHGQSLAASKSRLAKLHIVCRGLGDPIATQLTAKDFAHYRDKRLKGEIDNGYHANSEKWIAKPVTVNREQQYLEAVFNELKRLGEWSLPNPLEGVRVFKEAEKEMSWLTQPQIREVLNACESYGKIYLTRIVKVCLATGARWSEAERLTRSQLSPHKLTFTKTKGKKNRTVPIPRWLYDELAPLQGKMFHPCYQEFKKMLALTDIELAEGQKTHVLRHTFASHFMMNGGNILVLQRILGHSNIRETMRYAHFAPDHLEEAVTLNPISNLTGLYDE